MWRPFHSLLKFWTPRQSTCGVRSARLSCFGRHTHNHTASVLLSFPDLDASHSITRRPIFVDLLKLDATKLGRRRPFCTPISIWTPLARLHGVRSAQLPRFGRHPNFPMASIPHGFPNLDAIRTITRRPILLTFSNWTPLNSDAGVCSCCSP